MIITDEKFLHQKCENAVENEIGAIIDQLERELDHSSMMGRPGIGLAANQIGIQKKVAIIRIDNYYKINLVNCHIQKGYDQFSFENEGCLSIPNKLFNTKRYNEIYAINNMVYPHSFVGTGLFAVAIQHELDHLNSILISDIAIEKIKKLDVGPNEKCPCGSGVKYKKCCKGK